MPVASESILRILFAVFQYLLPFLAVVTVILIFFYLLSENRIRREKAAGLPGFGTIGELVVLSGSRNLDTNTWFPVPREGVLGAVRSCDLVIPCSGVHAKHFDFSWEDGTGLLIYPRTGCEVLVNGYTVNCRTAAADYPMTHGSVLQVGSATLRLHLFAALDNTGTRIDGPVRNQTAPPPIVPPPGSFPPDLQQFPPLPGSFSPDTSVYFPQPLQQQSVSFFSETPELSQQDTQSVSGESFTSDSEEHSRPRRSDRWKEDLGE